MLQLTLTGPQQLEWREAPAPRLTDSRAALVRPVAVGVCDFDRALVSGRYTALPYPIALGHEIVAEVVEVGAHVRKIVEGMTVLLPLHISCGECRSCRSGRTNSCTSRPPLSNYGLGSRGGAWGGGMSDLLVVPFADAMAVQMPTGLSAIDCAAIGCNLVDLYRAIAPYLASWSEPCVLIVGGDAGNMALYGVVLARALGVERVDYLDDDGQRLAAAEMLGARPIALSSTVPRSSDLYPIVVDCSGIPERLALGLSLVGPDGVCTGVWPHTGVCSVPIGAMFMRNATFVTGQPHARSHMEPVLQLMQAHGLSSTSIQADVLRWENADRTFGFGTKKQIFVR